MKNFSIPAWCKPLCITASNPAFENDFSAAAKTVTPHTVHQAVHAHPPSARRPPAWLTAKLSRKPKALAPELHGTRQLNKNLLGRPLRIDDRTTALLLLAVLRKANILDNIASGLMDDINTVLKLVETGKQEKDEQKAQADAADAAFRKAYAPLFEPNPFTTFRDPLFRELMRALAAELIRSSARDSREMPVVYPGFKVDATRQAYERILASFKKAFAPVQSSAEQAGPALARIDPASIPLPESPTMTAETHMASTDRAEAPVSPEENQRVAERINAEVNAMQPGNEKFRRWLDANGIEAVPNSGYGLNCLIIALLQHATGAYGTQFEPGLAGRARRLRKELGIEQGMLYSDGALASRIIDAINNTYNTRMVLVEVQASETGLPFISTPLNRIPDDGHRVVLWQRGDHFEALRAREAQPAS